MEILETLISLIPGKSTAQLNSLAQQLLPNISKIHLGNSRKNKYIIGVNSNCQYFERIERLLNLLNIRIEASFNVSGVLGYKLDHVPSDLVASGDIPYRLIANLPCIKYIEQDILMPVQQNALSMPACVKDWGSGILSNAAELWGLDYIDGTLDKKYTFQRTGVGVRVYVVDSGIRAGHLDFTGRASMIYSDPNIPQNSPDDCSGHGTHVAGIIGGLHAGVAKNVSIKSLRVIGCNDATSVSEVVGALSYLSQVAKKPAVINLSLGAVDSSHVGLTLPASIAAMTTAGYPFVIAAGNSAKDACKEGSITSIQNTFVVGALAPNASGAVFSNFGSCVNYWAPGQSIWSASLNGNGFDIRDGTSQAAPFVTGTIALILEASPSLTPEQLTAAVRALGTQIPDSGTRVITPFVPGIQVSDGAKLLKFSQASCSGLSGTSIAWIAVGILLSLFLCCIGVVVCIKLKLRRKNVEDPDKLISEAKVPSPTNKDFWRLSAIHQNPDSVSIDHPEASPKLSTISPSNSGSIINRSSKKTESDYADANF